MAPVTHMKTSTPAQIFKWISVVPGALLYVVLSAFIIHWVVMLIQMFPQPSDDGGISVNGKSLLAAIPPETLERFGDALFFPLVFIDAGARIAPKFKLQTGIGLAILWLGLLSYGILSIAQGKIPNVDFALPDWWFPVLFCALSVAGTSVGLYEANQMSRAEKANE